MYVIEETEETIMEHIYDPDEDANVVEEPSSENDSAASVSQMSQSSKSFELMQMRVDAKEALASVAEAEMYQMSQKPNQRWQKPNHITQKSTKGH